MTRITKKSVLELATLQSQRAQAVTGFMRSHGYRFQYESGERVEADDEYRRHHAQLALDYARLVERDARAIRTHVEAWARQEGAH